MSEQIGIIGLGYVGLQLAVAFGEKLPTIGYDLSARKIDDYRNHLDVTGEVSTEQFKRAQQLTVTNDIKGFGRLRCVNRGCADTG